MRERLLQAAEEAKKNLTPNEQSRLDHALRIVLTLVPENLLSYKHISPMKKCSSCGKEIPQKDQNKAAINAMCMTPSTGGLATVPIQGEVCDQCFSRAYFKGMKTLGITILILLLISFIASFFTSCDDPKAERFKFTQDSLQWKLDSLERARTMNRMNDDTMASWIILQDSKRKVNQRGVKR